MVNEGLFVVKDIILYEMVYGMDYRRLKGDLLNCGFYVMICVLNDVGKIEK